MESLMRSIFSGLRGLPRGPSCGGGAAPRAPPRIAQPGGCQALTMTGIPFCASRRAISIARCTRGWTLPARAAAPGDAEVLEVVVDDLRVDASVLQAEVSAESIEDLAGMRGVEGDSDGVLVDLAGHFEGEAVLAGLAGSGFADEDGEQDLEVVAALAAVVADDDQGRVVVEGHLDLAGAGREARALSGGAQVFILLGDAGGERRAFGGGRIGIDELYGAAGKDRGGEFDAEEGAADRGLVGGREFEIDFGGTGAGVCHDFGGGHRPAGAL